MCPLPAQIFFIYFLSSFKPFECVSMFFVFLYGPGNNLWDFKNHFIRATNAFKNNCHALGMLFDLNI